MRPALERARARLLARALVGASAWVLAGAFLAAAVVVVATRAGSLGAAGMGRWYVLAAALLVSLVVAVAAAFRSAPDLNGVARQVERHFGLAERLSTSLELGDRTDALALLQLRDAEASLANVDLKEFAKPRLLRSQVWALLASGGLLLASPVVPLPGTIVAQGTRPGAAEADGLTDSVRSGELAVTAISDLRLSSDARLDLAPGAAAESPDAPANTGAGSRGQAGAPQTVTEGDRASRATEATGRDPVDLDRAVVRDEVTEASREPAGGDRQGTPPDGAAPAAAPARDESAASPPPAGASTRDQELREYARRREAADAGGGGGGDPVALVDAAVAGDATADVGSEALPEPGRGPTQADDLDLTGETDPSGRRVRLERLPDDPDATGLGAPATWVEYVPADEPRVSRPALSPADQALLERYRASFGEAP